MSVAYHNKKTWVKLLYHIIFTIHIYTAVTSSVQKTKGVLKHRGLNIFINNLLSIQQHQCMSRSAKFSKQVISPQKDYCLTTDSEKINIIHTLECPFHSLNMTYNAFFLSLFLQMHSSVFFLFHGASVNIKISSNQKNRKNFLVIEYKLWLYKSNVAL